MGSSRASVGCPAGRYVLQGDCADCSKGSYCTGGSFTLDNPPQQQSCPANMTTRGMRATSIRSCVNILGHSYALDSAGAVSAVECPPDTFSPGLRKQRACVPCPTGFTTNGQTGQSSPSACVVPGGSYLKGPGQVAACPKGEYKSGVGAAGNCTKCPAGVTTAQAGSDTPDACKVLLPGFYAASITPSSRAITAATVCPQGFYCGGGLPVSSFDPSDPTALSTTEPSIRLCPQGTLTKEPGATDQVQCITPPGFFTANGQTLQCPGGSFRPSWLPAAEAANCTACGDGLSTLKSDAVTFYDIVSGQAREVPVTTSAEDCYIQPGQGLYYATLTGTWRARNCDNDTYGVPNITFGLTPAPCKDCPRGLVARRDAAYSNSARWYSNNTGGAGGFVSGLACVTQPGWGYSGRVSQPCDQGTYNEGDNLSPCRSCPLGLTTTGVSAGRSLSDCRAAPGYGAGRLCAAGTYNDAVGTNASSPCTQCPTGTTTAADGATSAADCGLCVSGYGGAGCGIRCGGVGDAASYGPPGRAVGSPCVSCSSGGLTVGYSFSWNMQNDLFTPQTVSRAAASSPVDCLSEYSQLKDGAWFLPLSSTEGTNVTTGIPTFADCVAVCSADRECQLLTYDYRAQTCLIRRRVEGDMVSDPWLALKAMPAGFSTASALQQLNTTRAHSATSGTYTFTQDAHAASIGIQYAPVNVSSFASVQDCLEACDYSADCAGFTILATVAKDKIGTTCMLIKGDTRPGRFLRTVVRTDPDRVGLPGTFLCPSGFHQTQDVSVCVPITTVQQVTFALIATGTCDATAVESARAAVLAYLSDPAVSFGVYTPNLRLTLNCMVLVQSPAPAGHRRLAQSAAGRQVILSFKAGMTGTPEAATTLARKLEAEPCSIPGICSNFTNVSPVLVSTKPIQIASVEYDVYKYAPGAVKIRSTYKVDGTVSDMASAFDTTAGIRVPCTSVLGQGSRLYTCNISAGSPNGLQLIATTPNVADVTKPLVQTVSYTGPGLSITPPQAPIVICTDSASSLIDVEFVLQAEFGAAFVVPATITTSDNRVCSTQNNTNNLTSSATITYGCPRLNNTWSPGSFSIELVATAEQKGLSVQASASATVTINGQPTVAVSAIHEITYACSDSTDGYVDVVFSVQTDTGDLISMASTIPASDGRDCILQGSVNNLSSPSNVTYKCPRLDGTWAPATFTLQATASAGSSGCSGQGLSSPATVAISARPGLVTVTPSAQHVTLCSTTTSEYLDVAFRVEEANGFLISVPRNVTASDGRVCTMQGDTTVPNPTDVVYRCPKVTNTWSPSTFTIPLVVSAGQPSCYSVGAAVATAMIASCVDAYTVVNISQPFESACLLDGFTRILVLGDEEIARVELPFPVVLYETFLTSVDVTVNGFLASTADSALYNNFCGLPTLDAPPSAIFAYWSDLTTSDNGVCIATRGTAPNRQLVVTWDIAYWVGQGTYSLSFSIVLTENSADVDVVYGGFDEYVETVSPTVAIQNQDATKATVWRCSPYVGAAGWNNTAIRFTRAT